MKFMMIRRADDNTEAEVSGAIEIDPQLLKDMLEYHEQMAAAGVLVDGGGLQASRYGKLLQVRDDSVTVVDGPYAESKELIAGYTVLECESFEQALEWAKKWPKSDGPVDIELRPFHESEDLTQEPEIVARFEEMFSDKS
jgi:PhnB protein